MNNFRLLLWIFYKPLLPLNLIFTICALYALARNGLITLPFLIGLKILGYATCVGYQYFSSPNIYYFYRNTGHPVKRLYTCSFITDFILFMALAITVTIINGLVKS